MTGFGVGDARLGEGRVTVEVRSLNHRFVEVRVRVPTELSEHSFFLEQACRERFKRGRHDVTLRLGDSALPPPRIDLNAARNAYHELCRLRDELCPQAEVPITAITAIPSLFATTASVDSESVRHAILEALDRAVERLDEMRSSEGEALEQELSARLAGARAAAAVISKRAPELTESYRRRLKERIQRMVEDTKLQLDAARLEVEVAILADRGDIAEELARLESHFVQFERLSTEQLPVGRRLDFLLQEVSREANTIGSKSQDVDLSHAVVQLKAEVERLREQVQNVE